MKLIQTVDAEGTVLCHDITQIIKGVTKDAVFRKGHVVTKEDIPVLFMCGRRKTECFMRMMRQRFSATCAKGSIWSVPRQRKERLS